MNRIGLGSTSVRGPFPWRACAGPKYRSGGQQARVRDRALKGEKTFEGAKEFFRAQVSLFLCDNGAFIVESFLPETAALRIVTPGGVSKLVTIPDGEEIAGNDGKAGSI